jgi:mRNA-degrading endonuclease HigB of HigAB toxin-antitoxin module
MISITKHADWLKPSEVVKDFSDADLVKNTQVLFSIARSKYRLIVQISLPRQWVFIKFIRTHSPTQNTTKLMRTASSNFKSEDLAENTINQELTLLDQYGIANPASGIKHRSPSIKHLLPDIKHRSSGIWHQTTSFSN